MSKNIWVISDTHFCHKNIIDYCGRPFSSAREMDEVLIENWNSVVKPGDKIYHLGDVYMGRNESGFQHRLNGKKRLVLGNHDSGKDQNLQKMFEKIDVWRMFPEFGLLLTHVPVHKSTLMRGAKGDKSKRLLNIHGHIHNNESPSKHHRCVCVEQINYTPINIEELRKW